MSKDEKETAADAPKKKSKKLLMIIVIAVVLLGGGGAGAFFMLSGNKAEAIGSVPLRMVEDVALVGPMDKIRDELERWKETCLTTMLVSGPPAVLATYAELILG